MRLIASVLTGFLLLVAAAHAAPTVVSLEFDDGTSDQRQALPLLDAHGMKATFFVNSGRAGATGHMSWGQMQSMQADGQEIAGHTLTHVHLAQVSTDTARTQICDDRSRLLAHGLVANDFAYPFGEQNATVRGLVDDCGYTSGRLISGIDSIVACHGCPLTETIPPKDRYATRTPDSVRSTTTLDQLKTLVGRGGWIQLVMHHICDDCGIYAVSKSTLSSFLDWLATQSVSVKTVAQVMTPHPPAVEIVSPADGASGTGTVSITADGEGPDPHRVRFFLDGKQLGTRTGAPWRWKWDTTKFTPGAHQLSVIAEEADGLAVASDPVTFTVR